MNKFMNWLVVFLGYISWPKSDKRKLSEEDKEILRSMLSDNYYLIMTRRSNHLSTYLIMLGHWLFSGDFRLGYYSHVLMNLENLVTSDSDFRFVNLIEATGIGTHYSTFDTVFGDVDSVAVLKPRNLDLEEWTAVMDKARTTLGRPYDTLFDLKNNMAVSCVEMVREALLGDPNYDHDFAEFEALVQKSKRLNPQTFYECSDFEVVFERRIKV